MPVCLDLLFFVLLCLKRYSPFYKKKSSFIIVFLGRQQNWKRVLQVQDHAAKERRVFQVQSFV